jgi:hypothetical protein
MDRWIRFWKRLCGFLFRVFAMRSTAKATDPRTKPSTLTAADPIPPIRVEWQRAQRTLRSAQNDAAVGVAKVRHPSPLSGTPAQTARKGDRTNPFMAQWERHFDASQAFREVVVL